MNCRSTRERSNAAALGVLTEAECRDVFGHLACCPACHADFERASRTASWAARATLSIEVNGLAQRIVAAGRGELRRDQRWSARIWKSAARALVRSMRQVSAGHSHSHKEVLGAQPVLNPHGSCNSAS